MNNIERRGREMLYISDDAVFAEQREVRKLVHKFNTMDRSDSQTTQYLLSSEKCANLCINSIRWIGQTLKDWQH